jgi:cell shape-determining protein MreC
MNDKDKEAFENLWDEEIIQNLEAENKKLREALEFYTRKDDSGYLAKITLKEVGEK